MSWTTPALRFVSFVIHIGRTAATCLHFTQYNFAEIWAICLLCRPTRFSYDRSFANRDCADTVHLSSILRNGHFESMGSSFIAFETRVIRSYLGFKGLHYSKRSSPPLPSSRMCNCLALLHSRHPLGTYTFHEPHRHASPPSFRVVVEDPVAILYPRSFSRRRDNPTNS